MVQAEVIAHTTEIGEMTAEQLNEEQTVLSGRFAGTCYAKEGYQTIKTQPIEKARKRAGETAKNGHHSVFQHGMINMELNCPKIIAMLLNSIGISNTSEKSARYTKMIPETPLEQHLYGKWHKILYDLIKTSYGDKFSDKELDKLAYENARYMISVFCETSMVYSLPFRNMFYVMDFTERMIKNLSRSEMSGKFNERLKTELLSLKEAFFHIVGKENFHENKNDYFRFLPVQAVGYYDENNEYYGDVYTARYFASFAQVAQLERHRTTRIKVNFGGKDATEFGFYVPPLIKHTKWETEWLSDIESVKEIYPQGTLVSVTEQGLFEDFAMKCKERMCGRAQLEIMEQTKELLFRFFKYKENLSEANQKRLDGMFQKNEPCARCGYPDFTCTEGCKWGLKEALIRKI